MKNIDLVTAHATKRIFIVVVDSTVTRLKVDLAPDAQIVLGG